MRKLCSVLGCIFLMAAMVVTAAAAASAAMTISASKTEALRGETVSFSVSVSPVEDCRSAGVILDYDKNVFEFVGGKCTVKDTVLADFSDGSGVFALGSSATVSGEIFTFQLKVKDDADLGEYRISADGRIRDSNGAIATTVNVLTVTVSGKDAAQTDKTESVPTQGKETEPTETEIPAPTEETGTIGATVSAGETENTTPGQTQESVDPPVPADNSSPWWIVIAGAVAAIGGVVFVVLKKNKEIR